MDLQSYVFAIRRGWWLILVMTAAGGALAAGIALRATPVYAADVSFYISTPSVTSSGALSADQFAQDRANSYAQLLSSDRLGNLIASSSQLHLTGHQIAGEISGSAQLNTVLVTATVHDRTPDRALYIARSAATEFPKMVNALDNSGAGPEVSLRVVSGPQVDRFPISPRKKLTTTIGLLVGLVLGLFAAALREVFDTSVRGAAALEEVTGARTLATVPGEAGAGNARVVDDSLGWSPRGEAVRQLRTNLQFAEGSHSVGVVVVTSAVAREGRSTTAMSLAMVIAQAGSSTLLIESDLRHPQIAGYLGLQGAVGLTEVIRGDAELDDVLQRWGSDNLAVLVSGSSPPNPSEMLMSPAMLHLLSDVRERFDFVILDSPPLSSVTDAVVLATASDGVIFVLRDGRTSRAQVIHAVSSLRGVNARILGAVVTTKAASRFEKKVMTRYSDNRDRFTHSGVESAAVTTPGAHVKTSSTPPSPLTEQVDEVEQEPPTDEPTSDADPS